MSSFDFCKRRYVSGSTCITLTYVLLIRYLKMQSKLVPMVLFQKKTILEDTTSNLVKLNLWLQGTDRN